MLHALAHSALAAVAPAASKKKLDLAYCRSREVQPSEEVQGELKPSMVLGVLLEGKLTGSPRSNYNDSTDPTSEYTDAAGVVLRR